MGKYSQGILGPFSGKVGTVVGSNWRGINYMRSLSPKRGNAGASDKQLEQQAKFSLITAFLKPVKEVLEMGFKNGSNKKTGYNQALSYNLKNALTGTAPNLEIDYAMVLMSSGDLTPLADLQVTSTTPASVNLQWVDNTGRGRAKADDKLFIVVFCPELADVSYGVAIAERADESFVYQLPSDYSTETIEVYVGVTSANSQEVGSSKYAGSIVTA